MKARRRLCLALCILLICGTAAALLLLSGTPAAAQATTRYVTASGNCGRNKPCYSSIQLAVEDAGPGDVIKVAEGTYSGIHYHRPPPTYPYPHEDHHLAQVVYLDKSLTIQGGYNEAFEEPPDPDAHPTTLDAEGRGRVLFITRPVTVTIAGLRLIGGDATALGGNPLRPGDAGGGVYVLWANFTLRDSKVLSNTLSRSILTEYGQGAGLFLYRSDATLLDNQVSGNLAHCFSEGFGGGLSLYRSRATLEGNTITQNHASGRYLSRGGGLYLYDSDVSFLRGRIAKNGVACYNFSYGAGLDVEGGTVRMRENHIVSNSTFGSTGGTSGGGLALWDCTAVLLSNRIQDNITLGSGSGGGLSATGGIIALSDNTISGNKAFWEDGCGGWGPSTRGGGGLYLASAGATLDRNMLVDNVSGCAGGALLLDAGQATLRNNIIAGNQADGPGGGLYLGGGRLRLEHGTLVNNSAAAGGGLHLAPGGTAHLTNTIVVSHTVAISVASGSTATLDCTLWHDNGAAWAGSGAIQSTHDYFGDPAFAAPGSRDYHIGPDSLALDRGTDTGLAMDFDRQPRPYQTPDLGADEYWPPGQLRHGYLPLVLRGRP